MPADVSYSVEGHRPCLVVPVHEHHAPLERILPELQRLGVPILLVDDGSSPECSAALERLAQNSGGTVALKRRPRNGGKGAAVKDGLRWAAELGHTHALQVDADGQHDLSVLPAFLEASRREPAAAVCADPRFGADAPASRRRFRRLTNFWVAVNTLSRAVPDAMCGLRMYPLVSTVPLLDSCGDRMEFDPELLVRLRWARVPLRFLEARVRYPEGGRSSFRAVEDNARISWMHTRLFFGMLIRAPRLILKK
jgi:glycosyltransferase involved in cell wall biosynthesis